MTMKLPLRLPVLPSQCYSPGVTDYSLGGSRHETASSSRQPLEESMGNAQDHGHGHFGAMVKSSSYDYQRQPESIYSIPSSTPTPPVFPGQKLDFGYGAPQCSRLHSHQHHIHAQSGRRGLGKNPFWLSPQFQAYRKRQGEREEKTGQKWPEMLEEAFLDAFLIIPHIKKMKYSLKGQLYGRNMLIGEYVWLYYLASLPPGVKPDENLMRTRKQISSHIQVLKGFMKLHPYFNVFFPVYTKDKNGEAALKEPFKSHPVLVALTESRLPDVRPNYDYFAHILSLEDQVAIKPNRCWIFVSHRDVSVQDDGSGRLTTSGDRLERDEYPHLRLNLEREKWTKKEQQIFKGALLHEFTKDLSQLEGSTVREIADEWEDNCPELSEKLEKILDSDPPCDIIHMHSTLELKEKRRFPGHSDLNSWVEVNIEQPHLLNHRWKVDTTLVRPAELSYSGEESSPETVCKTSSKIAIQYHHRPGCEGHHNGREHCDGLSRCRRDCVIVPFPADVWALTLTNCTEYPAHPPVDSPRRGGKNRAVTFKKDEDDDTKDSKASNSGEQPTQMDLVKKIAMIQELWSCPPEDSTVHEGGESKNAPRWERRGVILWTFQTIHSIVIIKNNPPELKTAHHGKTQWRFLTMLDPCSQYHQQRVLIRNSDPIAGDSNSSRVGSFAATPSVKFESVPPSPTSHHPPQQHRNSSISEHSFPSTNWDMHGGWGGRLGDSLPSSAAATQAHAQAAYNAHLMVSTGHTRGLLDGFGGESGLATPPPSASLASSFAHSFDSVANDADHLAGYMAAQVTAAEMGNHSQSLSDLSAVMDPFLANAGASSFDTGAFDDGTQDDVSGWDGNSTVPGVGGTNGWPAGYSATNTSHNGGVLDWGQNSPSACSRTVGVRDVKQYNHQVQQQQQQQSQHHHHQLSRHHHQPQQQPQQHWVPDTNSSEETDFWTPTTSTHDAGVPAVTLDGRDQVIWATTSDEQSQQSSFHTATAHSETGASADDWVQIHTTSSPSLVPSLSVVTTIPVDDGGSIIHSSNSDLSQGWEEIVAASAATSTSTSGLSVLSSSLDSAAASQHYHHSYCHHHQVAGRGEVGDDVDDDDDQPVASFAVTPSLGGHHHHTDNNNSNNVSSDFIGHEQPRGRKRGRSDSNRVMMEQVELERLHMLRDRRRAGC